MLAIVVMMIIAMMMNTIGRIMQRRHMLSLTEDMAKK